MFYYGLSKFIMMVSKEDVTVRTWTTNDYFTHNDQFQDDFPVAFGISSYMVRNATDDANLDYGQVHAYIDNWNTSNVWYEELELRPCTKEDFGLGEDLKPHQRFNNATGSKKEELLRVMSNLKCIDKAIKFQGDYHSSTA